VLGALALLVAVAPTRANSQRRTERPAPGVERSLLGGLELWGGLSGRSQQWGVLGETPDMSIGILALRWSRAIGARPADGELSKYEWTVDLIPLARLSPSLVSLRGSNVPCNASLCVVRPDPSAGADRFPPGSPVGLGITPLGLTRRFGRASRVSPFVGVAGGFLWFDERVPTTQASAFNFTASAELGLRLGPPRGAGVTVAYRFHHLSNAGMVGENPGVASHVITVGIHRPRSRRSTSPGLPSP